MTFDHLEWAMRLIALITAAACAALTATAANAAAATERASGWTNPSASLTAVRYRHGRYFARNCCVLGPAYGRPGEWLGPAYNMNLLMPSPRVCGPGACQDNPLY
jgi:hypothetical protein